MRESLDGVQICEQERHETVYALLRTWLDSGPASK
jgi:hypothetical protein